MATMMTTLLGAWSFFCLIKQKGGKMQTFLQKISSRKFWMAVAAFLASIGGTCAGFASNNEGVMIAGVVCTAISAAIYAGSEAYVDAAREGSNTISTTTTVTASTTSKETVEKLIPTTASTTAPTVEVKG